DGRSPSRRPRGSRSQRLLQALERAHDAEPCARPRQGVALTFAERKEVPALELQWLVGVDLRAPDVAGPRLPLPEAVGRLPGRLLVDRHLALQLHVVEDDHLLLPDDGDL